MNVRLIPVFALMLAISAVSLQASIIDTSFSTGDGFLTGVTDTPVTLNDSTGEFSATFLGGVQQQFIDGASYNTGPDAYLVVNGTFINQTDNNDTATITFSSGVELLSFFAADRANGVPSLRVFGTDGTILAEQDITQTSNQNGAGATPLVFDSATLGGLIGSVEFDNAGPAGNAPYVIAIDSFSATFAAVPEPSSVVLIGLLGSCVAIRRRKS